MHRINRVLSWGAAGLLSLGLAKAGWAQPEPAPPPVPAPGSTTKATALIVGVDQSKRVSMHSKRLIRSASVDKEEVARVQSLQDDPKAVLVVGRRLGTARVRLIDDAGTEESIDVIVELDLELLKSLLKRAFPTAVIEPVALAGQGGTRSIMLTGTVAHAEEIEAILRVAQAAIATNAAAGGGGTYGGAGTVTVVNALTVAGVRQVQLDVVIAAVSRTELRNFGINFTVGGTTAFGGSLIGNLATLGQQAGGIGNANGGPVVLGAQNFLRGLTPGPQANIVFGIVPAQLNTFIQALRQERLAKLLAEPRLVTLSGRPARFNSGGMQALPVVSGGSGGGGVNAVGSELVPFGTELVFLPIVLGNGKIYLDINTSVSSLNAANGFVNAGIIVQGRDSQSVQTHVMMEPGQTFAVGGLIQNTVSANTSKTPILGDLPFIGPAFSTVSHSDQETELVVLVTPYLVDPQDCKQTACKLPGLETRTPDDFELFLELILEAPRGQREVFPNKKYKPAYMNDPSADKFPCGGAQCATGCGTGGCNTGCATGCATGNCGAVPANVPVPTTTPTPAPAPAAPTSPVADKGIEPFLAPVTNPTKYYTPTGTRGSSRP